MELSKKTRALKRDSHTKTTAKYSIFFYKASSDLANQI